jgi:hypothetical protein
VTVGTLFTEDFLAEGIRESAAWKDLGDTEVAALRDQIIAVFRKVANPATLNEAQTQHSIIDPVLHALGWAGAYNVQTNLDTKGRANVPDYSFFGNAEAFEKADRASAFDAKLKHAVAVGDAKQWSIGLDQSGGGAGLGETPASQMIRYLTRAETNSDRAVRWGILTNGRHWRLYFTGSRSLLDGYFEADLAWMLGITGIQGELASATEGESEAERRDRHFRTFLLFFRRAAFTPSARHGGHTFPEFAFNEGRLWETKVRTDLSRVVFDHVFPGLIRGLASTDPDAPSPLTATYLNRVREAALTKLYRLLFALYAEDRELLPTRDSKFDDYALSKIRDDVAARLDREDAMTNRSTRYWDHCVALFRIVDEGAVELGIPPYNGGLFSKTRAPMIEAVRVGDAIFAPLLDMLSRTHKDGRRVRINFRDLSVRELGAIYEGLLEYEPVADPTAQLGIAVRPNPFSRKTSGSYYTPDELVGLIIDRTVGPLVKARLDAFTSAAERLATDPRPLQARLGELVALDPAAAILELRVCDPAMGSGHFPVSLIDYLAGAVFTAIGTAAVAVTWTEYQSPIVQRLATIRDRIVAEATANGWTVRDEQLTDANLVKRMVLKRCVYGVDKNPMAVELAKVALWLHTFTTGAPLSFLDHHLKCGDSLFGEKVGRVLDELSKRGALLISDAVRKAEAEVADMETVENYTDAEVAEVKASASAYAHVEEGTAPLKRFLDFWQAIKWLDLSDADQRAIAALLDGRFGDPVSVAAGITPPARPAGAPETLRLSLGDEPEQLAFAGSGVVSVREWNTVSVLIERAHALAGEEHFFHWEVAFPGVWQGWPQTTPDGGFDAIVGNPPWDRMKMQEVEWFAARDPKIAKQARAADRKAMVAKLIESRSPLGAAYELSRTRAEKAMERARKSGEYPLLSRGDINLYSLFVERAQSLIRPTGIAGLLTPSGISSDLTASAFFKSVASAGRVHCLFDFENRRGEGRAHFFPDVDSRFKFCAMAVGGTDATVPRTLCAFFLRDLPQFADGDQLFEMTAADFALVNPNTATAPIFRTRRDAGLTTAIYGRVPVLVDRSNDDQATAWSAKYVRMFDMTNDSGLFWTQAGLEAEGAYPIGGGRWRKGAEEWVPLYVGRMVHHFDHRAASVETNEQNLHNAALSAGSTAADLASPDYFPTPQYWVRIADLPGRDHWSFAFRDIARSTDERTAIGSLVPSTAAGNTLPIVDGLGTLAPLFASNFSAFVLDYVARQKNQSTHLNWYIVEQLPFLSAPSYAEKFGTTTAADIILDHVLRLTYTAHDMAFFARDMGYDGPPFAWDETERRHLRARLDALYFHLYGITDEADIRYILSTFPIVERKDRAKWGGVYLTAELIIWYFRALATGDTESVAPEAALLRQAARKAS